MHRFSIDREPIMASIHVCAHLRARARHVDLLVGKAALVEQGQ